MKWVFSALVILVIVISIIIILYTDDQYYGYEKATWANNTRVLGLLASVSLLLFGYACQIGYDFNKYCGPLLCLTLIFILIWIYSLTCLLSFSLTCISSWIIFILTLTVVIILGMSSHRSLSLIALPFLAITLLMLSISHDILSKNCERPEHISV